MLSINGLAREIDVPPNRISEIGSGKRAITDDTALRLGKYRRLARNLLGLQADYDLRVAKRTTWLKAEPRVRSRAALAQRLARGRCSGVAPDRQRDAPTEILKHFRRD